MPSSSRATRWFSTAGVSVKTITAAMPAAPASRRLARPPSRSGLDRRSHGHRHRRLHGHARRHGLAGTGCQAGRGRGPCHRCRGRSGLRRHRALVEGGLHRRCLDRAAVGRTLSQIPGSERRRRSRRVFNPGQAAGQNALGGCVDSVGSITLANFSLRRNMAARSLPAASRKARTCRQPSCPSSCAA